MDELFKELLGKKRKFGARIRWDNGKSRTESTKYYRNTIKALADIGKSNSILGESAEKKMRWSSVQRKQSREQPSPQKGMMLVLRKMEATSEAFLVRNPWM